MKNIRTYILAFLAFLLILAGGMSAAEAASLEDRAGLLTPEDRSRVEQTLSEIGQKHGVTVNAVTIRSPGSLRIGDYASRLRQSSYRSGQKGNMLLVISAGTSEWYISTDPDMRKIIPDKNLSDQVRGSVLPLLKQRNFAEALMAYGAMADQSLSYYEKKGRPYAPPKPFSPIAAGISVLLAALLGIAVRQHFVGRMSNVRPALAAGEYLDRKSFALEERRDIYLHTRVSVVPKGNSHHGSIGGGGGSGGGTGGRF